MKNNKIFRISFLMMAITSLFTLNSCQELEEDTLGTLTADNFFGTKGDLDAAVTAQYNSMLTFGRYVHGQTPYFGSDDLTTFGAGNKAYFREYDQFNPDADNGQIQTYNWNVWWKMVLTTNTVIDHYQKVDASQEYLDQSGGQAYFLRGLAYFYLVRTYGQLPLLSSTQVTGLEGKASFEAIYDQIISDFTKAKNMLPVTWGAELGRPTKWSAQSYLAHAYLTTAGFPLKKTENYALAAAEAKSVIDNGPYALISDFEDLWNSPETQDHSEAVFSLIFCKSCGGIPNSKSIGSVSAEEIGWEDFSTEIGFFNGFPEGARKEATFTTVFYKNGSDTPIPWESSLRQHPTFAKWKGTLKDGKYYDKTGGGFDLNVYLMRYAELLLTHAEATVMSTSSTNSEALESLNKVKRRAAGLPVNVSDASVDVTSATQAEIVQERAWELAGEYSRWFDMVRTEIIQEVSENKDPLDLPVLGSIDESNPWALIPSGEVELNPNLGE